MTETPVEPLVVVLDDRARPAGSHGKLAAHHAPGVAHLAFSVLLHDAEGRLLLQRRARDKHHFAGRWANTCCSHPAPGERLQEAAIRRLREELRLTDPPQLTIRSGFWYQASDPVSSLVETEYDVVLAGRLTGDETFDPDPAEVAELAWLGAEQALQLADDPHTGAPWLRQVLAAFRSPARELAPGIRAREDALASVPDGAPRPDL